jgi:glycosyltransferase involved in cell wall biosynthesis
MTDGLVSVVMPAFNEEAFIAEALESVLNQSYEPIEVLVVDDGSADRSAEIASAHDVQVLRRSHLGPAAARNAGLELARGDYWTIFDADDLMLPGAVAREVEQLREHSELGIVFGLTEAFVTPGEPRPSHFNPAWDDGPFPWHTGTMLARRAVFELVGPFDETRQLAEDMDWLARAKAAGVRVGQVDHVALRYRVHAGNVTADTRAVNGAMLAVLRASVHRRRLLGVDD